MKGKASATLSSDFSHGGPISIAQGQLIASWQNGLGQPTLAVENYSASISVGTAYPSASHTFDITKSGYTPLGIIGYSVSNTNFRFLERYINGNNCYVYISCNEQYINVGSVTVGVDILYMQNY